jgi:hypothetical protein
MGSASYWWGRLASLIQRLVEYIFYHGSLRWVFRFADDFKALFFGTGIYIDALALILFLISIDLPMKWKKFGGGFTFDWIGFAFDYSKFTIGLSEGRAQWLCKWCSDREKQGIVDARQFVEVLGRMGFSFQML